MLILIGSKEPKQNHLFMYSHHRVRTSTPGSCISPFVHLSVQDRHQKSVSKAVAEDYSPPGQSTAILSLNERVLGKRIIPSEKDLVSFPTFDILEDSPTKMDRPTGTVFNLPLLNCIIIDCYLLVSFSLSKNQNKSNKKYNLNAYCNKNYF